MTRRTFLEFAPPCLGDEEIAEVVATMRSGWLTTGPRAREFEERFAAFVGAPAALALNSCSAGLHAALFAAGVGPGDAVVTSTMTFAGAVHAIEHVGARPLFADVDYDTLNVSPRSVADVLARAKRDGTRVRALLPVHFAGHPCDVAALAELAAEHGLALVEDAAHALPSRVDGRLVGAPAADGVASFASFSFYANKNVTTGEGGMLVGPREAVERARTFSRQGLAGDGPTWRRDAVAAGFKFNMPDVAAAIGLRQFDKLPAFHARRVAVAARYSAALRDVAEVAPPTVRAGVEPSWHLYVVRIAVERLRIDRDRFVDELAARNIGTSVHFRPVHLHAHYRDDRGDRAVELPNALAAWPRVLSLPIHPAMTDADVDDVVAAVVDVVRRFRR
jgi:dTDP-4-amino-4,6-dideoxygalactose transaminase